MAKDDDWDKRFGFLRMSFLPEVAQIVPVTFQQTRQTVVP